MEIIELIIDENDSLSGIDAISVVENPAIMENFIALSKHETELKEVDPEKKILMGAALIPNKQIYRQNKKKEGYYIFFSEDTIRKASELFLINSNQNNATYEHESKLTGLSVVESWIIEDTKLDKSVKYGFNLPVGTWMVSMKVNNEDVWSKVKEGKVKGFSIEGSFADKLEMSLQEDLIINQIKETILKAEMYNLENYNDYPQQATENAKIALRWAEQNGWGSCGNPVGKARANQFRNENLSANETHYTIDGKIWNGEMHKGADGRLMTGAVHTADGQYLYHAVTMTEILKHNDENTK